jgi:hypothetical protein
MVAFERHCRLSERFRPRWADSRSSNPRVRSTPAYSEIPVIIPMEPGISIG